MTSQNLGKAQIRLPGGLEPKSLPIRLKAKRPEGWGKPAGGSRRRGERRSAHARLAEPRPCAAVTRPGRPRPPRARGPSPPPAARVRDAEGPQRALSHSPANFDSISQKVRPGPAAPRSPRGPACARRRPPGEASGPTAGSLPGTGAGRAHLQDTDTSTRVAGRAALSCARSPRPAALVWRLSMLAGDADGRPGAHMRGSGGLSAARPAPARRGRRGAGGGGRGRKGAEAARGEGGGGGAAGRPG